jgi:hypothetical protein
MSRFETIKELYLFIKLRKKWWLLPIITILILLAAIIIFAESSALAPFIYALF